MRRLPIPHLLPSTLGLAVITLLSGCATPAGPGSAAGSSAPTATAAPMPAAASLPVASAAAAPAARLGAAVAAATPAAGAASAPPRPAAPPAAPPAPGTPPPFDTVVKDATKVDGLFTTWRKDDKVWLELKPTDFDKPFFFSPKITRGIGERFVFGGLMGPQGWGQWGKAQVVEFRKVHNQVRLVAVNTEYLAKAGTPEARAVAAAFSPSLLGSTAVASAAHPERKTVLVEAGPLLLADIMGMGMSLQRIFRQGYSLDGRHSSIDRVRGKPDMVAFEVTKHFYTPNLAPPPQPGQAPPGALVPLVPTTLPDARSFFVGMHYSLSKLPEVPMAPRRADPRVGHFATTVNDFTSDMARTPKQRYAERWRLEKKDPAAEMSEPVKPITFWLDRNIPVAYRGAIGEGVLEWNKAFEKIGFKNAVIVKQQPDDADFDTHDMDVASIRWMTNAQPSFGAIGPNHVDPRTGEILDADIAFESLSSRSIRQLRSQILSPKLQVDWAGLMQARDAQREAAGGAQHTANPLLHRHTEQCQHADFAAEQLGYLMDVLEARGEVNPDSPEAHQWVLDYLKDTTMHEVGHTLGLRHNFRSSRIYSDKQLSDPEFTKKNSLAGSVMEYAPLNIPRPGESGGTVFQLVLGPYDYWAIEYAYKPIPADQEAAELRRIAARSSEPELAYGTDEDNGLGIDPETLVFDLGDDPVAFAQKRLAIAQELIKRQETRALKPDTDYAVLRRAIGYAVRDAARGAGILARQIGGIRTLRDFPGSGRDPLVPVPATVQRNALDTLVKGYFSADSFKLSPALQRRLAPDFSDRYDATFEGQSVSTDFSIGAMVLEVQRALLAQLMSDGVATRILDSAGKADRPAEAFSLAELYGRMGQEIWSELAAAKPGDIAGPRRELQREHVNRLAGALLRPSAASRADTRSLVRSDAEKLLARINAARKRPGLSAEARAHLDDSADTLSQAIGARLQRAGV